MAFSSDPTVRVAVLGPVLIEDRGHALGEPSGALGKSLIVALVLARGFSLTVSNLVDDLWSDTPPRHGRAALQTLVSRMRASTADGILESTQAGYALALDPEHTDLGRAALHRDRAIRARAEVDQAKAATEATLGLQLWRGEPGADLGATPLADDLALKAAALRGDLLRVRGESRIELGDAAGAISDLRPLIENAPVDEDLQLLLMRATVLAGRRNEALRLFAEFRARLREQLGTRPGEQLVAYHATLLRAEEAQPSESSGARIRRGLRSAPNVLLGRDRDIAELERIVATSRLTTILGPGGIGKTRVAQELGNRASTRTPAVIVVELASVRTGDNIPLALASTLGIREIGTTRAAAGDPGAGVDLRTRILASLAEQQTLLIVDNCEHIVDSAAAWVADILDTTSTVRVLATSRAPLAISAERVYQLDSLQSVNETDALSDGPAVQLFVERARAARPTVVLPHDLVANLCDRLDGLPLAIELAAARTRSMSVEEIDRRLGNRFALLTGGQRTAPERHRTLLAVIDWSWNLLGANERLLLRRLSRFPDGFSTDAVEAVAGTPGGDGTSRVIDDLDALVNQSLVSVSEDPETGILRYRMLETVREFGDLELTKSGEVDLVREGMYDWAVDFALIAIGKMTGPEQLHNFQLVTSEQDNLVSVLRSALDDPRPEVVAAVFGALGYYWTLRGAHTEVVSFGVAVMKATTGWKVTPEYGVAAASAFALIGGTFIYVDLRTAVRAISRLRAVKRTVSVPDPRLDALTNLLLSAGRTSEGMALLTEYQKSADPSVASIANMLASGFEENAGDLDAALRDATTSYELALNLDDLWSQASAAQSLAQLHSQLAHRELALYWADRAKEGLSTIQASGELQQLDWLVAVNSIPSGQVDRARQILQRFATEDDDRLGFDFVDLRGIGRSGLAEISLLQGDTEAGLRQYREALESFGPRMIAPIPWLNIVAAGCIAAHARADAPDHDAVDTLAAQLRVRVLVAHRLRPGFTDKPVLGTSVFGLASWLLWRRNDLHDEARIGLGFELFALAERLNSRQDMPSLDRANLEAQLREAYGADGEARLVAVRTDVARLTRDEAAGRAIELLGDWRA